MPSSLFSFSRQRAYWGLQLIGWPLYSGLGLVLISLFSYVRISGYILAIQALLVVILLATSHALRAYFRRRGWLRLPLSQLLWRLALANGVAAILAQLVLHALIVVAVRPPAAVGNTSNFQQFIGYVLQMYFVLWFWTAFYVSFQYLSRYRQAEVDKWKLAAAVKDAEMRTLKAQINPHFMFNGLNNIRALVLENPDRARHMITHLADLLRYSIQLNSTEQVPLAREVEIVQHYLDLEAVQLEERLTYSLTIDPAVRDQLLPPMTLQLLVENAIKHGIAPQPAGGFVHLTAGLDARHRLQIVVRNSGHYAPLPDHAGVGLRNARERLHLLFGEQATLTIGNDPDHPGTVMACLVLPISSSR